LSQCPEVSATVEQWIDFYVVPGRSSLGSLVTQAVSGKMSEEPKEKPTKPAHRKRKGKKSSYFVKCRQLDSQSALHESVSYEPMPVEVGVKPRRL
ncbi:hypothetical protein STEG23_023665, partial [Scotinomys teguina]